MSFSFNPRPWKERIEQENRSKINLAQTKPLVKKKDEKMYTETLCDCFQLPPPYENIYIPKQMIPNGFVYNEKMLLHNLKKLKNYELEQRVEVSCPVDIRVIEPYFPWETPRRIIHYFTFKSVVSCEGGALVWLLIDIWSDTY